MWKWSWPSQGALNLHVVTVENHKKTLVMTADVMAKALTRHLPNASLGTSIKSIHSVLNFHSFTRLPCSQPISLQSLPILILHFFLIFQGAAFQERFLIQIVILFCIYDYHLDFKYCLIMYLLFRHVHMPAECLIKLYCSSVHSSITQNLHEILCWRILQKKKKSFHF